MKRVLIAAGLGLLMLCLSCMGFLVLPETLLYLTFGWIPFLVRVVPDLSVNGFGILTGLVCVLALGVGLHGFCEWLYREIGKSRGTGFGNWPVRWTVSLLTLVVLMFVAGISTVGVAHQAAWLETSPEPLVTGGSNAFAGLTTANNLKQVGLALHNYHDGHKQFPPGCLVDPQGRLLHGWETLLLPFIAEEKLFQAIDFATAWDDPQNRPSFKRKIKVYLSGDRDRPIADAAGYSLTHFAGNVRVLGGEKAYTFKEINDGDGTANTLFAGEVNSDFKPWGYPANWRDPALGINRSPRGFGGQQGRSVAVFLFADGGVRNLSNFTSPAVLKALSTPNGGEAIPALEP